MRQSTFPRSGVLVVGANYIQSLLPSTLRSQAESLLESHRTEDAIGLADQQRKKLESNLTVDDDESEELCYVYQRIGFQCLSETLFEDAGNNFFAGDLDPRALISYYPDLRGSLFSETDTLDIYAGVAEHMPRESSIDEIIRNYSPHLDTHAEPSTVELRKVLGMAAREMLEKFLRRWKKKREVNGEGVGVVSTVNEVVDTVIAKIFAEEGKTADLYTLLRRPNYVRQAELEPVLTRTGRYRALCTLYEERGEDDKLLDAWSKLAEGDWTDDDIADPLSSMFTFLMDKRDRKLIQQWGIWLIKRDPERALKLLTSRDMNKRRERPEDELLMLQQVTDADPAAGVQFLEYLVLQKRSLNPDLHMRLADSCVDQLLTCVADASTSKLWRAKALSYTSSRTNTSFLSYFASTTPDSEHKRVRLKTALFLQGSALYVPEPIKKRLMNYQKVLQLEVAIVDGKLGNHRAALSLLVHDLRDATSAEAYCTLGGEVVPGKIAQVIGDKYGLRPWSSALFSLPTSAAMSRTTSTATTAASKGSMAAATSMARQKSSVDEGVKKGLLKILLEVYMNDGESERTAHLLNSQAMNLDVVDVIPLVPPNWPLSVMSSFLARSFRRTLHSKHEGQIVKAICSGQNLEVADSSWLILREQGAIIEEADDDDDSGVDTEDKFDEKDVLAEKVGFHLQEIDIGEGMGLSNEVDNDDGTRKEIRRGESETDPPMLK